MNINQVQQDTGEAIIGLMLEAGLAPADAIQMLAHLLVTCIEAHSSHDTSLVIFDNDTGNVVLALGNVDDAELNAKCVTALEACSGKEG